MNAGSTPRFSENTAKSMAELTHTLADGTPAHGFSTLLAELATIVRNTCRTPHAGTDVPTFYIVTSANPKQKRALQLIQQINV